MTANDRVPADCDASTPAETTQPAPDRRDATTAGTVGRRKLLANAGAVAGAAVFGGCLGDTETASETITVTDTFGREVTVPYPVESLVLLNTRLNWAARLLGIQDRVLAVAGLTEAFPELDEKPEAGWYREPDYELIADLEPQVLVTQWTGSGAEEAIERMVEKMDPFGIEVVVIDTDGLQLDGAKTFAQLFGKEDEIDEFLDWTDEQVTNVESEVRDLPADRRPTVYCEPQHAEWEARVARPIDLAGGRNVLWEAFDEDEVRSGDAKSLGAEFVYEQDPEMILIDDAGGPPVTTGYDVTDPSDALRMREEFMTRSRATDLSAVKAGNVHTIDFKVLRGEMAWAGVSYLAKLLHPDRFPDLDPEAIHAEYYEDWLDVPFQGEYVVPGLE